MNTGAEAVETAIKIARSGFRDVKGVPCRQAKIPTCEHNLSTTTNHHRRLLHRPGFHRRTAPFTLLLEIILKTISRLEEGLVDQRRASSSNPSARAACTCPRQRICGVHRTLQAYNVLVCRLTKSRPASPGPWRPASRAAPARLARAIMSAGHGISARPIFLIIRQGHFRRRLLGQRRPRHDEGRRWGRIHPPARLHLRRQSQPAAPAMVALDVARDTAPRPSSATGGNWSEPPWRTIAETDPHVKAVRDEAPSSSVTTHVVQHRVRS